MRKSVTTLTISILLGNNSTNFSSSKSSNNNNSNSHMITRLQMKVHKSKLEKKMFTLSCLTKQLQIIDICPSLPSNRYAHSLLKILNIFTMALLGAKKELFSTI